jgi:hypothetical protein
VPTIDIIVTDCLNMDTKRKAFPLHGINEESWEKPSNK